MTRVRMTAPTIRREAPVSGHGLVAWAFDKETASVVSSAIQMPNLSPIAIDPIGIESGVLHHPAKKVRISMLMMPIGPEEHPVYVVASDDRCFGQNLTFEEAAQVFEDTASGMADICADADLRVKSGWTFVMMKPILSDQQQHEIAVWIDENLTAHFTAHEYFPNAMAFESPHDAFAFKMRWA